MVGRVQQLCDYLDNEQKIGSYCVANFSGIIANVTSLEQFNKDLIHIILLDQSENPLRLPVPMRYSHSHALDLTVLRHYLVGAQAEGKVQLSNGKDYFAELHITPRNVRELPTVLANEVQEVTMSSSVIYPYLRSWWYPLREK